MKKLHAIAIMVCLLLLAQPILACPYDTGGHIVNIRVIDSLAAPIPNATITANGIQQKAPEWFWSILGVKPAESPIELTERNGTTNEYGIVTFALYEAMLYNVTITCSNGKATAFKLYPYENEYNILVSC
jgi:hypothetical protein